MKKFLLLLSLMLSAFFVNAQTWDGSASTDWNDPQNWTPATVPLATGNVTINTAPNSPSLPANITANTFSMNAGSALNFNGFSLTINGNMDINGATLTNSNGGTDITITFNGTGSQYIRNSMINDHIILNHTGTGALFEAFQGGNTYNGNATFNHNTAAASHICYNAQSSFLSSLTVNRTVAGSTEIFEAGFIALSGNFSYTNTTGGASAINGSNASTAVIGGTVNINASGSGNPAFTMRRIKNSVTGGSISVQNSSTVTVTNDTLLLTALNVNGFTGGGTDDFDANQITATVNISDDPANTGSYYFRNSIVNGNTTINVNGDANLFEAFQGGNIYNGNTSFNFTGTGSHHICYNAISSFLGNLTINRTAVGTTGIFETGFISLSGNFAYTNASGGNTTINGSNAPTGLIGGTVNVTASGIGNPIFTMRRIKNSTTGGTVSVQNSSTVTITNDTLLLTAFNVNGFTGGGTDDFDANQITAAVNISDDATNTGSYYFRNSLINGNTTIAANGDASLFEAYQGGNNFNGNTSFSFGGAAPHHICYNAASAFGGNVTVTRNTAGSTDIFESGFIALNGNFSYTNTAGGASLINASNLPTGPIPGTVNITANGTGNPAFTMKRINNNTTGGTISVQNSGTVTISNDTLLVAAFNVNGFTGGGTDDFNANVITGTVNISDDVANTGSNYSRNNIFNSDVTYTFNSDAAFFESYQGSNIYNENVTLARPGNASINFAYNNPAFLYKSLFFNSTGNIAIGTIDTVKFVGSANAVIEQLGTGVNVITRALIAKTGSANITLNDPVTISNKITFVNGDIISSNTNPLSFISTATHSGESDASHVNGTALKVGTGTFTFPVGDGTVLKAVSMTAPANATDRFSVKYFNDNPFLAGYDTSAHAGTLLRISGYEYWDIRRETGTSNVSFTFNYTDPGNNLYITNPANARIAHWTGSTWEDLGNGGSTGTTSGTVTTGAPVSGFTQSFFTFGSTNLTDNPLLDATIYTYYADADSDNFGDLNNTTTSPSQTPPAGYVADNTDCDDDDNTVYPGAPELCDNKDNDCDGTIDDGVVPPTFYLDFDNDGFGDAAVTTQACTAPIGYVSNDDDCDDNDNTVYPNAPELCDGKDNDCDGTIDDGVGSAFYRDLDNDGFGDVNNSQVACSAPIGFVSNDDDCDDTDNTVFPGAPELCDGKDNNCNGTTDEGVGTTFYRDFDNDGFGDANGSQVACSAPVGYVSNDDDCDDNDNTVYPNAPELCDGKDNDCDGTIDDGAGTTPYYADADGDGFGDPNVSVTGCTVPPGYVSNDDDCDDADNTVYLGAPELCDGKDNNCDGNIDEGVQTVFFSDADGDGFGNINDTLHRCIAPAGYVLDNTDCDDNDNTVYPNAPELCDGKDNDCDGTIDDGAGTTPYYADADADGFGDPNVSVTGCTIPPGYVSNDDDCDDTNNAVFPGAPELCDGKDNNCNGNIDEGVQTVFYADTDGDGFGNINDTTHNCSAPTGYVLDNTDCDDADNSIYPNAPELCDGKDNNCDGSVDEGVQSVFYADADGDGFGNINDSLHRCIAPPGYVLDNTDCDDTDGSVNPVAPEITDGKDNDCDGQIDEGGLLTFYLDSDNDGFGDINNSVSAATAPPGYVSDSTDCDDADNTVYPGAPEICDGKDNDCDGTTDGAVSTPVVIGPTNMCPYEGTGQQVVFTINPLPGVTGYQWTVPGTINIISGQNTNTLTVTIQAGFAANANKQIRVTTTSICGTSPLGIHYLLAQFPSTPGFITGPVEACSFVGTANEAVYKINKVMGATSYIWTVSSGMSINSHPGGNGVNDTIINVLYSPAFTGGTITVRAANNCGSSANLRQLNIVNGTTSTPGLIQGPANACLYMPSAAIPTGTPATYIIRKVLNATSYTWTVPANASATHPEGAGVNDTVIVVTYSSAFTGGNITVSANGSCASSGVRSLTIQVNLKPGTIAAISANETQSCPNRQVTYSIVLPSNTNWVEWTVPAGAVILNGQGTASIVVSYSSASTGLVTATPSNGCGIGKTRSLQVNTLACRPVTDFAKGTITQPTLQQAPFDVQIYPNPAQSEFNITIAGRSNEKIKVRIYDINGKQYLPEITDPNKVSHFGNNLKPGVYMVEVMQGNDRKITRVIKF